MTAEMTATVTTPADQPVLRISRRFKAPRALVFRCYTDPMHAVHFWGPHGSTTPVCDMDLRVGGVWRTTMRFANGEAYSYNSVYLEISPPERLVYRDAPLDASFGSPLPPVEIHTIIDFVELGAETRLDVTVTFTDIAARDRAAAMGFAGMVTVSMERFAAYVQTLEPGSLA